MTVQCNYYYYSYSIKDDSDAITAAEQLQGHFETRQ